MKSVLQCCPSPSFAQEMRRHKRPRRGSLSPGNRLTASNDLPPRPELISRVRAEIAAGTYDTRDKLYEALDRMFEAMAR